MKEVKKMEKGKNMENERVALGAETLGLLAGGLAHDYNNMLTAMLGGMELILCENLTESARVAAEDVKATMLKAAVLVRRMLSCAGGGEPQMEWLDLGETVSDVVRIMRRSIPDNIKLIYERPTGLPKVMADAAMIWQAVMNLLTNACDAMGGDAGCVEISVVAGSSGSSVMIMVRDNGCGMDAATKARIFEPLFTTKATGNGLGLASVRMVMDEHGGVVDVESELGRGSTFRLVFPAFGEHTDATPAETERKPSAGSAKSILEQCKGSVRETVTAVDVQQGTSISVENGGSLRIANGVRKVLVVDDDASIVKLLKIILEKAGYEVATAQSGEAGLDVYHAEGGVFGMCLIDASMGAGMSGLDLCAAIRGEDSGLPLVLMSAYRAKEMNDRMASSGVTTFLPKPFRGGDVLGLCSKYIGGAA